MMVPIKIIVVFCLVSRIECMLHLNDAEIHPDLMNALMEILRINCPHFDRKTIIVYGRPPAEFMEFLMNRNVALIVMNNMKKNPTDFVIPLPINSAENYIQYRVGVIVFFTETEASISEGLAEITQSIFWASDLKIIVYSRETIDIARFFFLCWWYKVLYALVLELNESQKVLVHEYTPFVVGYKVNSENQFHCWSTVQVQDMFEGNMAEFINCTTACNSVIPDEEIESRNVLTCIEVQTSFYSVDSNIFIDKTVDFKEFELNIFAVNVPLLLNIDENVEGMKKFKEKDGYVLSILAEKMNFGGKFINDQDKESRNSPNFHTFLGGLLDVSNRKKDIYANPIYVIPISYPVLELTYPIEGSGLCFIVKKAGVIPNWMNIINIFDFRSIILLMAAFHIVVFIYFITLMSTKNSSVFDAIILGYIYTLQLFLSLPVNWVGKKGSLRSIVFILFWLIFLVNYIFQGLIVSLLTVPRYNKNINTFQELYDSGLLIEGFQTPDMVLPPTSKLFIGLNSRFKVIQNFYSCVLDLRHTDSKACWLDCNVARRIHKTMKDDNGKPIIHVGKDKIHSHSLAYPMQKDCPWKRRFDHYLSNIMESGLMKKWITSTVIVPTETDDGVKILILSDFLPCFVLFGSGLGIAFITFVMELILFGLKRCFQYYFKKRRAKISIQKAFIFE